MDERIIKFIAKQKVLTFSTSIDHRPYSASCYYAFDQETNQLIFSSEESTKHIQDAQVNNAVSGTINASHKSIAKIQGIQYQGKFIVPNAAQEKEFYACYFQRFPFAKAKPAPIWAIELNWVKMTDNTLGFGTKLEWHSNP